jgi:hypothetical protein
MSVAATSEQTECTQVTLEIPRDLPYQLVYRQERNWPLEVAAVECVRFFFCSGPREWLQHAGLLRRALGLGGLLKGLLKSATRSRRFYFVADDARVLHHGWVTLSRCRYYRVEKGAAVIGPIWTAPEARSRGIGTFATALAVNALLGEGHRLIYIDTSSTNLSCQKVISKCEFGSPIAVYIRSESMDQ